MNGNKFKFISKTWLWTRDILYYFAYINIDTVGLKVNIYSEIRQWPFEVAD